MILFVLVGFLGEIDVILAKGKYGQANKCTKPKMNQRRLYSFSACKTSIITDRRSGTEYD